MTQPSGKRRFLVLGLPRSGTTYLSTLLNSHSGIYCSGEQFNPHQIVGVDETITDWDQIIARDFMPRHFARKFFETHEAEPWARIGFKFMLGHNTRVLSWLPEIPEVSLIFVHRENKLAQISSLLKASETLRWAQTRKSRSAKHKIDTSPQHVALLWHEYASMEFLFRQWLQTLPNPRISVEYRQLFEPGFVSRVCEFLKVDPEPKMKSPLVKQGANRILDRFQNPGPIEAYFTSIGRGYWLEDELR